MWTLIVMSTFWAYGAGRNVTTYEFHPVASESRCLQLKEWINRRELIQGKSDLLITNPNDVGTHAQCVKE